MSIFKSNFHDLQDKQTNPHKLKLTSYSSTNQLIQTTPDAQKDVHDYQNYSAKNKRKEFQNSDPKSLNRCLEYYLNNQKTIEVLKKKNIKELYPIQCQTFRPIFQGFDIIARDRTGSGKTLAFTLPVLERLREARKFENNYPKFLIILPTRELAIQVHNEIESLRFKDKKDFVPYVIYGKTSIEENIRKLKQGVDILVATPGRLNDLVKRQAVRLQSIEVLCLDEADEILKQGFKEEIEKVFSQIHKVNKNKIQTLLFSATIPQWLRQLSQQYQDKNTPYINMIKDDQIKTSPTIKHYALEISKFNEQQVIRAIQSMVQKYGGYQKRILIFCQKKIDVDRLSKNLQIQNQPLHGDVNQKMRQNAYSKFKNGLLKCIVATNVAARGLDFPSVDLVIQMSPPLNTEEYIHRAGRTGRAGKQGVCITFYDRTRSRIISKIQSEANIRMQQIRLDQRNLSKGRRDYQRNDKNYSKNKYETSRGNFSTHEEKRFTQKQRYDSRGYRTSGQQTRNSPKHHSTFDRNGDKKEKRTEKGSSRSKSRSFSRSLSKQRSNSPKKFESSNKQSNKQARNVLKDAKVWFKNSRKDEDYDY